MFVICKYVKINFTFLILFHRIFNITLKNLCNMIASYLGRKQMQKVFFQEREGTYLIPKTKAPDILGYLPDILRCCHIFPLFIFFSKIFPNMYFTLYSYPQIVTKKHMKLLVMVNSNLTLRGR